MSRSFAPLGPWLILCASLAAAPFFSGCEKPKPKKAVVATPATPTPIVRSGNDFERFRVEEALKVEDVSFMFRTGSTEAEILQEIVQRGFVDPISPAQAQGLAAYGATPAFISNIQDRRYVLNPDERAQYEKRSHRRGAALKNQVDPDRQQREAEFSENQRQFQLQQQNLANVEANEAAIRRKEQAKKDYEKRRKYLEERIQQIQDDLTRYRRYGYKEEDLRGDERRLKQAREELHNLKAP